MAKSKIVFACDLDNTLIHSHRYRNKNDICIEFNAGVPQSFISDTALEMLKIIVKEIEFIPVTTRSIEQYQRIEWDRMVNSCYALVAHGGILLKNNKIDMEWIMASMESVDTVYESLIKAEMFLRTDMNCTKVRMVNDIYLFAWSEKPDITMISLKDTLELYDITVINNGHKIYLLPCSITKGQAVNKLMASLDPELLICAGDSELDIDMLDIAGLAIVPNWDLARRTCCKNLVICNNEANYGEYVLGEVMHLIDTIK